MSKQLWKRGIAFCVGIVLTACGGSGDSSAVTTTDTSSPTSAIGADLSALRAIPVGSSVMLHIPTYDGKDQVVHPDVVVRDGLFYLVVTPYPWGDVEHENPSFYVSGNGIDFTPATNNPIIDHPKNGYNDDPDVIVDPGSGEFRIYYNETPKDYERQYLAVLRSPDGVNWVDHRKLIAFRTGGGEPFIVSPAVVYAAGLYFMFHVEVDTESVTHSPLLCQKDPHRHVVKVLTSSDGMVWNKRDNYPVTIDYPAGFHPWHLNIIPANGRYYMLLDGYESGFCDSHNLYLAVSDNLTDWHFISTPVVTPQDAVMPNIRIIYRSAGIIDGDDMYIYFSFYTDDNRWFLGLKHIRLSRYLDL